jgi:signal transduction histidine kinase
MTIKYYVLPKERKQIKEDAVKRAITSINGPVGFYEQWPGEAPQLTVTDDALNAWRPFCRLVCEDKTRQQLCQLDYEDRAAACTEPQLSICWVGIHNLVCPVEDEHGGRVTLIGGEFRVCNRRAEAQRRLQQFLEDTPPDQRRAFQDAWGQVPEVTEAEALSYRMRELELAGRSYLHALKQLSDFRYKADLATHDVAIALQALIGEIEVLKIELKEAFGIGKKWQNRFETLIRMCNDHYASLERRLELDKSKYAYGSISKLLYECVDRYRAKAKRRWIELRVDLEQLTDEAGEHEVLSIRMDRVALKKAFLNILDNAVKYSFDGTPDRPRWIGILGRLQTVRGVPGYSIVVRNLGVGIEQDELELVFEAGYQGRRRLEEHRKRPGYGMGLTAAQECVEAHGGTVDIQSSPQRRTGWLTTLTLWLPLHGPSYGHSAEA